MIGYYHGRRMIAPIITEARVRLMVRFLDDNQLRRLTVATVARRRPP